MHPFASAMETVLGTARDQVLAALEGIPEDELARWRTTEAHGDINTMYGLATHIVGSGEFWILEAAGGRDVHRQRLAEFTASGSLDDLRARFDRLLADTHEVLGRLTEDDLKKSFRRDAAQSQGIGAVERTVAECLVHALTHIALHLGHLQIQRQLWEQERGQG